MCKRPIQKHWLLPHITKLVCIMDEILKSMRRARLHYCPQAQPPDQINNHLWPLWLADRKAAKRQSSRKLGPSSFLPLGFLLGLIHFCVHRYHKFVLLGSQ